MMPEEPERAETAVDLVTCELMLETARACRALTAAAEETEALIRHVHPAGKEILLTRRIRRIELFSRLVPSILDPRRIVCLGDRASDNPSWWRANRIHFFCPELSFREIGELTGLKHTAVRDYIKAAEIPGDCYENLPETE